MKVPLIVPVVVPAEIAGGQVWLDTELPAIQRAALESAVNAWAAREGMAAAKDAVFEVTYQYRLKVKGGAA